MKKATGNMYEFITHTWNPVKGACIHKCVYCYVRKMTNGKLREVYLDRSELNQDLGKENIIFVCSGTDLFAENVKQEFIENIFKVMAIYDENIYLLQSKNPKKMFWSYEKAKIKPSNVIFATTLETNRNLKLSDAPSIIERANEMILHNYKKMVTIEPIVDFDLEGFFDILQGINPAIITIGADSKNSNLPEPSYNKIVEFVNKLIKNKFKVYLKHNLKRILDNSYYDMQLYSTTIIRDLFENKNNDNEGEQLLLF